MEKNGRNGKILDDKTSVVNLELKKPFIPSRNIHRRHSSFAMEEGERNLLIANYRRNSVVGVLRGDDAQFQDDRSGCKFEVV